MRYHAILDAIATLQTQPELRRALLNDPAEAATRLRRIPGLEPSDIQLLSQLPVQSIQVLDATARFHRWTRIQEHLPWLDPYRRIALRPLLEHFLLTTPPCLLNREDALAFCRMIEALPPAGTEDSPLPAAPLGPFLQALCRFERLRIELAWGLAHLKSPVQETFPFPVLSLKSALEALEVGWPLLRLEPVQIRIVKVPLIPGVTSRELPAAEPAWQEESPAQTPRHNPQ